MPRYYPVPSLTKHRLYEAVRACTACALYKTCDAPVPPVGPTPAHVMIVLEAPARQEQKWGVPVTGATWNELEPLLRLAGLSRDTVWLSNAVHCTPPSGDPTLADTDPCFALWKPREIALVQPAVAVLAGQLAIRRVLGDASLTVEEVRGYPIRHQEWGCWLLPTYHPAAALHQDRYRPALREDFLALKRLKLGVTWGRPVDLCPQPVYKKGLPEWM